MAGAFSLPLETLGSLSGQGLGAVGEGLWPAKHLDIRFLVGQDGVGKPSPLLPDIGRGLGTASWGTGLNRQEAGGWMA